MRSLQIDSFRATRVGLGLAMVNLLVLLAWFFLAHITLYEASTALAWGEEDMLAASFAPPALARLRQGQEATVRLNPGPDQPVLTFSAYLYRMPEDSGPVLFYIQSGDVPDSLRQAAKLSGQVEVGVEQITPAELVLRNSGKYFARGSQAEQGPAAP